MFSNTLCAIMLVANWSPYIGWLVILLLSLLLIVMIRKADAVNASLGYRDDSSNTSVGSNDVIYEERNNLVMYRNGHKMCTFSSVDKAYEYVRGEVQLFNMLGHTGIDSDTDDTIGLGLYNVTKSLHVSGNTMQVNTWHTSMTGGSRKVTTEDYVVIAE
jgi:hypothetical protein